MSDQPIIKSGPPPKEPPPAPVKEEKTPRNLKVFIWRKRTRGLLVVVSTSLKAAREAAIEYEPNVAAWVNNNEPTIENAAKANTVVLIKHRI